MATSLDRSSARWDTTRSRAGRLCAGLALVIGSLIAQAQVPDRSVSAAPRPLARSMEGIRKAFLANDVGRLAPHFPSRQPVLVRMPPFEQGGVLGPGPLRAFLTRMIAGRSTVDFEAPDIEAGGGGDIRVHVKVRWTYRETGSATLHVESLHLALRYAPEDAEWLIVEMKTASR